jgi:quinol monooxygenase YgiN
MPEAESFTAVIWEARAKPGREAEMRAFLTAAVTVSRNDAGCVDYEIHEVVGAPGVFIAYERWISSAALENHLRAPRMTELVPQLLELMQGSIEDGMRLIRPIRPVK